MIDMTSYGANSGLKYWVIQRFSGVFIILYFIYISSFLFLNGGLNYDNWSLLFSCFYFKTLTVLFTFSLSIHSSIGLRIILTDYIKNTFTRVILDYLVNITLICYIFFIMQILWGFK